MSQKLIIPLIGNPNCGKSAVAAHLAETYGFAICRPSELIQAYAQGRGVSLTERGDYARMGNMMIEEYGDDYLVNSALTAPGDRVCVDGERIPRNIERLQSCGARVVALWCPIEIRFQRAVARAELRDSVDFQTFAQDEASEYCSAEPPYRRVMTVMQMADHHVDAARPLDEVIATVDSYVEPLLAAH